MLRTVILVCLLLVPGHAVAGQSPEQAYEACLIGNSVIGVVQLELRPMYAYDRAADLCSDVAETVTDADAIGEGVLHHFGYLIAPMITPDFGLMPGDYP